MSLTDGAADWFPDDSDRNGRCLRCPSALRIYCGRLPGPPALAGKKILFLSDFHVRSGTVYSFPSYLAWNGTDWIARSVREAVDAVQPDFFIFGGDLASEAAWLNAAFDVLADLPDSMHKLAVPGNWDRRRRWLPPAFWRDRCERIGFHFLLNADIRLGSIHFAGMDDFKMGDPAFSAVFETGEYNCILAHNPDTIPAVVPRAALNQTSLILCGHTHGGQIRLPLLGAWESSTVVRKRFERGLYRNRRTGARMYVSAGIGATWLRLRFLCPPEGYCLEFT